MRLEEALVECLDWIRRSDVYDDQLDEETRWVVDGEIRAQPPQPGSSYGSAVALQAGIDDLFRFVADVETVLDADEWEAARARVRMRRGYGLPGPYRRGSWV